MRLLSKRSATDRSAWKTYAATTIATVATAAAGSAAVDADSAWYRSLSKPSWQPPSWAFGVVWTPLAASSAVNLIVNGTWNWLLFRKQSSGRRPAGRPRARCQQRPVIVVVVWLLGFVIQPAASGGRKGRWYRW